MVGEDKLPDDPPTEERSGRKETETQSQPEMVRWTRAVAVFTGFLVIANVIANFFIHQQWVTANRAQSDTREQLRAVVAFAGFDVIIQKGPPPDNKTLAYAFAAKFQNFGGTRTNSFRAWDSIQYFDKEVPNNVDLSKPRLAVDIANATIGPNSPYSLQALTLSPEEADKIAKKEGIALIWGWAEYSDVFQPSDIHPLRFCVVLSPINTTTGEVVPQPMPYKNECNSNK